MGILNEISEQHVWRDFLIYKKDKAHLTEQEEKELYEFIEKKGYEEIVNRICNEGFCFDYPEKKMINKIATMKKRTVYSFKEEENLVLKLITYLLYRYDFSQSNNCYSFRRECGAKKAIRIITNTDGIDNMYCYKVDVKNYFNSINVDKLLIILKNILYDDVDLYNFFKNMLTVDKAYYEGELICEKRGAMAGTPVSVFFANVYLKELDNYFENNNIQYARYSDDIIVFANTKEELDKYINYIYRFLDNYDLEVNKDKESVIEPGNPWEFLGIQYFDGTIDLSENTKQKMKGKIRRKARALYRWKLRKGESDEKAMKAFIRSFNKKLFENSDANELTWSRWFFPLINTDTSLREIDSYMQQYIRYISTGKHNKANYRIDYVFIKECGYKSLVNEYYKYLSEDIYVMTK